MQQAQIPDGPMLKTLGLLPDPGWRLRSFAESFALNVVIVILAIWFALARLHHEAATPRYQETLLTFPRLQRQAPRIPRIKLPPPHPIVELPRKISSVKWQPKQTPPEMARLKPAAAPIIPSAPALAVVAPPQPRVGLFAAPKASTTTVADNAHAIKSGGFGDPAGVAPNPNTSKAATIASLGSFTRSPESGKEAGQGYRGGATVASAGFGNAVPGGGSTGLGSGHDTVSTGSFGKNEIGGIAAQQAAVRKPSFIPPQVLAEPRPQYTEEARHLKIQGEITLQVCFGADGKVHVLRVVSGLGHGLDNAARLVAEQIRFKPATLDGQPADDTTLIHILFQLA